MARILAVGADHGGYELKNTLIPELKALGFEVIDFGTNGPESVDYPHYAALVAEAIVSGNAEAGMLVCGTGIGVAMAANRYRPIRCAHVACVTDARLARQHNNANIIAIGGRTMGNEVARDCIKMFFSTAFEGGRHARRVAQFS